MLMKNFVSTIFLLFPSFKLLVFIFVIIPLTMGIVPPGICEDGTDVCPFYKPNMCPSNGQVERLYETYAYCCCRKTCGLCDHGSVEQRVTGRFQKYSDRSSYDWSGQQWRFGNGWKGMDKFSRRLSNAVEPLRSDWGGESSEEIFYSRGGDWDDM